MAPEQFDLLMTAIVVPSGLGVFFLSILAGLSW